MIQLIYQYWGGSAMNDTYRISFDKLRKLLIDKHMVKVEINLKEGENR